MAAAPVRVNQGDFYMPELSLSSMSGVYNLIFATFVMNLLSGDNIRSQIIGALPITISISTTICSKLFIRALKGNDSHSKIVQCASVVTATALAILLKAHGFDLQDAFWSATLSVGVVSIASIFSRNPNIAKLCSPVIATYILNYLTPLPNSQDMNAVEKLSLLFSSLVIARVIAQFP